MGPDDNLSALDGQIAPLLSYESGVSGGHWLSAEGDLTAFRHYDEDGSHNILLVEPVDPVRFDHQPTGSLVLVRSTKLNWSSQVSNFLSSRTGLTPAEIQVSQSLMEGLRSDEIAVARGSKKSTVRQQIKSVMEKTQTSTQAMLVALLVSLHHLFGTGAYQRTNRSIHSHSEGTIHETIVEDTPHWGTIDFELYGKPGGEPVFFLHSQMSSAKPTEQMIEAMAKRGLLVFAPRKPGLGQTSPEQLETDPKGFVSAFISMMGDSSILFRVLVGHGMSGVAMVDWAAQNPSFSGSVVTLDTGIPFTKREQFEHMPPVSKRIFWTVWDCPELFYAPFAFASEALFASKKGEAAFMNDQFKDIIHDFALIEDPCFYGLARLSMRDFMSTPKRSADELVYWVKDWTPELNKVAKTGRLTVLQSEHHDFLRFSDTANYFEQLPGVRLTQLDNCAQLCMFEKPDLIAAEIVDSITRLENRDHVGLLDAERQTLAEFE